MYSLPEVASCENYIANYKTFHEHQLNSRRFPVFPGVVDTLRIPVTTAYCCTMHIQQNL